jgi:phage gp45-like
VAADADSKMVQFTSSSSVTVTVPPATFTAGQQINLTRYGTGSVTIQGGSGVTVNATPSLVIRSQYSAATLVCVDSSTFILYGDLAYA